MNQNLKIFDKLWFNNPTTKVGEIIGVIIARDIITGKTHAYIGKGTSGDIDKDTVDILEWGTKIDNQTLASMIS